MERRNSSLITTIARMFYANGLTRACIGPSRVRHLMGTIRRLWADLAAVSRIKTQTSALGKSMARRGSIGFLVCLALCSMLSLRTAAGQVLYGSVVGKGEDPTGAVVARARG